MESGDHSSLLGILPLLVAGFIFNNIFYYTRFRLSKADGQRLFFSCAISGLMVGGFAFMLCHALRTLVPVNSRLRAIMDWMHTSIPVPYGLTYIATIALAFALGHLSNVYIWWRKRMKAQYDKRRVSVWAFWRCMPEYITALDDLLRRAVFGDSLVLLCLKSRKVYCGVVSETRGNHDSGIAHVQIIPAFSITRNNETLQFEEDTRTEYKAYYLKRAFERLETLNEMINDSGELVKIIETEAQSDKHANTDINDLLTTLRQNIKQQKSEQEKLKKALEPYGMHGNFKLGDWVKVIPVTEIESASLYKDEDYGKWFSNTKSTPEKGLRYINLAIRGHSISRATSRRQPRKNENKTD